MAGVVSGAGLGHLLPCLLLLLLLWSASPAQTQLREYGYGCKGVSVLSAKILTLIASVLQSCRSIMQNQLNNLQLHNTRKLNTQLKLIFWGVLLVCRGRVVVM